MPSSSRGGSADCSNSSDEEYSGYSEQNAPEGGNTLSQDQDEVFNPADFLAQLQNVAQQKLQQPRKETKRAVQKSKVMLDAEMERQAIMAKRKRLAKDGTVVFTDQKKASSHAPNPRSSVSASAVRVVAPTSSRVAYVGMQRGRLI